MPAVTYCLLIAWRTFPSFPPTILVIVQVVYTNTALHLRVMNGLTHTFHLFIHFTLILTLTSVCVAPFEGARKVNY